MGGWSRRRAPSWRDATTLAVLALVALLGSGATPTAAQSGPWVTYPATSALAEADGQPYTLVVGDSLTLGELYSVQGLADHVSERIGRSAYVTTTPGGQWITYGWAGEQNGAGLVWDYADYLSARLTIIALGTNDARIMTRWPERYEPWQQYEVMQHAVRRVRESSRCVLLVNVAERDVPGPEGMAASDAMAVNRNMAIVARRDPEDRVFVADWNERSRTHEDWFKPADVHLTWGGQLEYARFISLHAQRLINTEGC